MTHLLPEFNGATVEVWEWISNFILHFNGHVITYPCQWCGVDTFSQKRIHIESPKLKHVTFRSWDNNISGKMGQYNSCWCPGS